MPAEPVPVVKVLLYSPNYFKYFTYKNCLQLLIAGILIIFHKQSKIPRDPGDLTRSWFWVFAYSLIKDRVTVSFSLYTRI